MIYNGRVKDPQPVPSKKIVQRADGTVRVATVNTAKSKTQRQFKDQTDFAAIMKKYSPSQREAFLNSPLANAVYSDLTSLPATYQEALDLAIAAKDSFMLLPLPVRKKFSHDPQQLMDFLDNPKNREEAIKLGLVRGPEKEAPPMRVRVIPEEPKS